MYMYVWITVTKIASYSAVMYYVTLLSPFDTYLHTWPPGSGSTYIYGYCDAHFKKGMTRDECIHFVKQGKLDVRSELTL